MVKKEVKVYECECERCGHKWVTRGNGVPVVCPGCKSPYWDRVKIKGKRGK